MGQPGPTTTRKTARVSPEISRTSLGDWLEATGTGQDWLAQQVGVKPTMVSRWCTGKAAMTETQRRLVKVAMRKRCSEIIAAVRQLDQDTFLDDIPDKRPKKGQR